MGKKPLVYTILPDKTLVFASEIKALLRFPGVQATMNPWPWTACGFGFNLAPNTFLDGIHQVMPGSVLEYDEAGPVMGTYWRLDLERPILKLSLDDAAEGLNTI
jgi:asparagine synthase (glutamine-hydrolysing)